MGVMVATVLVLILAHTIEIAVWSLSYALVGAAPAGGDLVYFALVNYTTLGYGCVTPGGFGGGPGLLSQRTRMDLVVLIGTIKRTVRARRQDEGRVAGGVIIIAERLGLLDLRKACLDHAGPLRCCREGRLSEVTISRRYKGAFRREGRRTFATRQSSRPRRR
jgi:hypothetical protein